MARPNTRPSASAITWGLIAAAVSAALIQYKARKAERENPPAGAFLDVDGVRLHYIERGLGVPLVMLHGNGTMAQDFEISGLLELASRKYRVIAIDRPGFGYSQRPRDRVWGPRAQAELLHRALKQLGVEQSIMLGHSWGTMVALAYALRYPTELRSMVLVSGYYYPSVRLDVPLLSAPAIPVIGDVMRHTVSPWIGRAMWPRLLHRMFGPEPISPKAYRLPPWMALRPSQLRASAAESALMIPAAIALMRRYADVKVPVHIVAGGGDQFVSTASQSQRLHRRIAGSTYRETPGAGHMMHHIAPEEVLAVIDQAAGPHPMCTSVMEDPRAAVSELPTGGDQYGRLKE